MTVKLTLKNESSEGEAILLSHVENRVTPDGEPTRSKVVRREVLLPGCEAILPDGPDLYYNVERVLVREAVPPRGVEPRSSG